MHIAEHLAATVLTFEWILHVQKKRKYVLLKVQSHIEINVSFCT